MWGGDSVGHELGMEFSAMPENQGETSVCVQGETFDAIGFLGNTAVERKHAGPPLQGGGRRFESGHLHQLEGPIK